MKSFYSWYKQHITGAIFIGLVLGILTGLFLAGRFEPVLTITGLVGGIYMNALNMMIFPLVFCSIIMGITSIGNIRTTGKITASTMVYFLCTTALASLVGLIIPRLIDLGKGVTFEMSTSDIQATEMTSILDTIENLIPANPVTAFAEGNMLQVLVFAVIIGFTIMAVGDKGQPLLNLIDSIHEICLKIISTVMYFTPIGVFCTIVPVVESNGTSTIISLATQLIILYIAFFGFAFIVYGLSVKFLGKGSPVKFFKAILPAALNAFGTCSSSATIPISKKCMEEDYGVSEKITSIVIPLGATVNMDAVSILMYRTYGCTSSCKCTALHRYSRSSGRRHRIFYSSGFHGRSSCRSHGCVHKHQHFVRYGCHLCQRHRRPVMLCSTERQDKVRQQSRPLSRLLLCLRFQSARL